MKNNRKTKELEIGTLQTLRKIGEPELYSDGNMRIPARWQEEKEPLDLGSIKKPKNEDILQLKIVVPSEDNIGKMFGKIFRQ